MRCGAQPAISTPSSSTRPLVGGTSPITARAVVVLPTPLAAGHRYNNPGRQREIDALQDVAGAVMGVERVHPQHQAKPN